MSAFLHTNVYTHIHMYILSHTSLRKLPSGLHSPASQIALSSPWLNTTCTDWHIKILQSPEKCNTMSYCILIFKQPPPVKSMTSTQKTITQAGRGSLPPRTCLSIAELSNLIYL